MAHYNNKRSNANTENIRVRNTQSSGFDLSHKSKDSGKIGHRELVNYEYVLSGDKMRLSTGADLQYQPTAAPMLPAMDMRIEHVFIPFRNINSDYEDMLSFVDGQPWQQGDFPHTDIFSLVGEFNNLEVLREAFEDIRSNPLSFVYRMRDDVLASRLAPYYLDDYAEEWYSHATRVLSGFASMSLDAQKYALIEVVYSLYQYFVGQGSLLDKLNCPILRKKEFSDYVLQYWDDDVSPADASSSVVYEYASMPIAIMPLRAAYADWFETTRDSHLEPASSLPRYHKLGNNLESLSQILFCYLCPRYCILSPDMYTTANIDSPYRHVIAPVLEDETSLKVLSSTAEGSAKIQNALQIQLNNGDTIDNIISSNFGTLRNYMQNQTINTLGIDLVALKRARMAKDWLMRGHVYGDEYQDYVLAQYGVKIEDSRINKPLYLGGYSKEVNINQTTNPTATSEMPAGAKNCTMVTGGNTDSFDFFSSENGIVLTWLYIVPAVTYEPYEVRNTICKGVDFPTPVFANDSEELSVVGEMSRTLVDWKKPFGRHPYGHAWRGRVDENHGQFLYEYKPYTFLRAFDPQFTPHLNAAFLHTHVNLDFMVDTDAFNPIWFGTLSHTCYVERKLPIVTDEC